jgi:ribosome-binding protein aMBF1 (putative translation factor)
MPSGSAVRHVRDPNPTSPSHASAPRRSNVAELEHRPVVHDHEEFLARARRRRGFQQAYDALETEYQVANELIAARARAGMTQDRRHQHPKRNGPNPRFDPFPIS